MVSWYCTFLERKNVNVGNENVSRCRAEFCMRCGRKWKTCSCAWFDHSAEPQGQRVVIHRVLRAPIEERVEEEQDYIPGRGGYGGYEVSPVRVQRADVYWSEY